MKNIIMITFTFLTAFLLSRVCFGQQYEDVVYLKNGSEIHGTIIEQVPNESIKIKTKDGNIFVYKLEEIERITKEEIKIDSEKNKSANPYTFQKKQGINNSGFGIRGGLGTDITGSIGFGLGVFYIPASSTKNLLNWDLGLDIYYANISESETELGIKYDDKTELLVFALRSNYLINYNPNKSGIYFLAGAGIVFTNVNWKEKLTYDPSYYPGLSNTETWSADAFAFGNVLNLGFGLTFGEGFETRIETPLLILYSTPGHGSRSAGSIAPTFTINLLYRFP